MNNVPLMCMRQRPSDLSAPFSNGNRIAFLGIVSIPLRKTLSLDQLHRKIVQSLMLAEGMYWHDVRMVECCDQFGFPFETFGGLLTRRRVSQHFQCHLPLERNLVRAVDDSHRALANLFDDFEIT